MTEDLRQRIDAAIRPTMLLGLQDAELFDAPGAERIGEWADWISKTVAELIAPEMEHQRSELAATKEVVYRWATTTLDIDSKEAFRGILNDLTIALNLSAEDTRAHLSKQQTGEQQ